MEEKEAQPAPEVEMIVGDTQEKQADKPAQTENVSLQDMIRLMGEFSKTLKEDNQKK